jgi:uncharacterized membrane protein YhaH (DUF805 family)
MPPLRFLPAITAAVTNIATAIFVRTHESEYPLVFLFFQLAMVGLALLMAAPLRNVWVVAFAFLIAGVLITGFPVGIFYVPTVVVAGWVLVRRLRDAGPSKRE